uniref:Uncharacterized protein n=1 Tax=Arundo donax TaxID=35708 RepID=A0A0A9B850_ARUDO
MHGDIDGVCQIRVLRLFSNDVSELIDLMI